MFTKPFGIAVRERRKAQELLQKDLARAAGISPQRLCQIELCQRQPTDEQQRRLQRLLGRIGAFVEPSGITRKLCGNGRRQFLVEGPRYDPPRDRSTFIRFATARNKYPDFVHEMMGQIERRPDFEECQAICHQLVADSAEEVLLILRLLHAGAQPCYAAPRWMVGVPHRIVDPRNGTDVDDRSTACLAFANDFYFFQTTLSSQGWRHRVDVLRCHEGACSVIEVDGYGHNPETDVRREVQIGLPTVRVTVQQLLDTTQDLRASLVPERRQA